MCSKRIRRGSSKALTENEEKEEYRCEVSGRKISKEEFESFEGMCESCYTEYLQQIEDDEGYYPE